MPAVQSLKVFFLLIMLLSETSCRHAEEGKKTETHAIYLNQSLLREAAPAIAKIWDTRIELSPDVASINDLWVDYAPGKDVSLQTALDQILHFIEIQHGVTLRWSEKGNRIVIEKEGEQAMGGNGGQAP